MKSWFLKKYFMFFILFSMACANAATHRNSSLFLEQKIIPGKTSSDDLKRLLGKPLQYFKERGREFYFYDVGNGPAQNATISVHSGVVEYVSTVCDEKLTDVLKRFSGIEKSERKIKTALPGRVAVLNQVTFDDAGRGFVYESRTKKIKTCLYYAKGTKVGELGE